MYFIFSSDLTTMDGHMNRVFALRYHPSNPNLLVSAGWDDTVQFWDTRVVHSIRYIAASFVIIIICVYYHIRKLSGPHICGDSLDIEPLTFNIVTGSWRYHTPLEVRIAIVHSRDMYCNTVHAYTLCMLLLGITREIP